MTGRTGDSMIYAALVLAALAAIASAPSSGSAVDRKLHWLLARDTSADLTMIAGAIGEPTTFPVSP
ncbi:MAG TPA: hypothetical protein VMB34_11720 [Acetobacteraceae bacterium]|nr:hypothetical protein [Acetobacteraceae bacterium]